MNETQTERESAADDRASPRSFGANRSVSLTDADSAVRSFVAQRPFAAVGLALVAGYLLGRAINAAR